MPAKTIITVEQFLQLPDDDMQHELDEGELIVMPPPKPRQGLLQARIARLLGEFVESQLLGKVFAETGYLLDTDPRTVRAPDVSFVRSARVSQIDPRNYVDGAPDLAIEIVSESDTAAQMMRKVNQYLRFGAHTVWVIYPELHQVHVFEAGGSSRILSGRDDWKRLNCCLGSPSLSKSSAANSRIYAGWLPGPSAAGTTPSANASQSPLGR